VPHPCYSNDVRRSKEGHGRFVRNLRVTGQAGVLAAPGRPPPCGEMTPKKTAFVHVRYMSIRQHPETWNYVRTSGLEQPNG